MDDKRKTKAQLLGELEELRRRVAQMEPAEEPQTNHHPPLRAWAEAAASAIFIFQDSVFRYTNPATSKITGYKAEELLGANIWKCVHPEHRELMEERLLAWQRGEPVPSRSEFKILTRSGQTRWINADSTFIEFDGNPAALTIAYDSTENKRAEDALKESEQRISKIIETAQEAIWMVDAQANTTYVNQHLAEMLGYTREEMVGRSVFDFVDKADRLEAGRYLERGRSGIREQRDFRFRRRDGSDLWTMVSTTPLFDGAGVFVGGLAMLIDITERKRTERALKESEALLEAAIENLPLELWARDKDGRCIIQNPYSVLQWGSFIGMRLEDTAPDRETLAMWETINRRAYAGEVVKGESEITDGEQAGHYYYAAGPICVDGEVRGILGVNIDITERKRAEEALHKTQERLQHVLLCSPTTIYLLRIEDKRLTTEWVSEGVTRLTGYEQSEALCEGWWANHLHPDDRERVLAGMPRLFTDDRLVLEYRFEHKDGGYLWLHDESRLLRDESGKPVETIGSWIDVTERREAEAALRDSEERFRTLVGSMDDIVFTLDRHQRHTGVFGRWIERFGIEREVFIGKTASEIHGIDSAHIDEEAIARALKGEQVVYEWSMANDQSAFHFQTSLSPIRDQTGDVTGLVGVGRDVTERKQADQALRASEERYRDLVENARDIIYTHDLKGNYTSVNKAVEQTTGYTREEVLTLNFEQTVAPEYLERARQMIAAKLAGQKETVYDLEIISKDGRRITVEVNTRLVLQDGVPIGIQGIARDVTERKRAEEALRESRSRLRAILDHCPSMIFLKDSDGCYLQVNRQFELTFKLTPQHVFRRTDAELFPPELAAAFRATDRRVLEAGRSLEFEESAVYADGIHTFIVHKFPLLDAAGNAYAVGGISTDITARKRAEDDLRKQKEIFQKIFDHIPVMLRFLDEDGRIKLVNQEWERTLGWSLDEIGSGDLDIFSELYPDPEYRQVVLNFIAASTGEFANFKTRARDGRVIDTSFANVRLEDGTNIGIGRDITERKQAADLLRRQTAQLAALHEIELEISAESELSRVLDVITRRASELLNAYHCSAYIRDREQAALNLVASLDTEVIGLRLKEGEGLAGRVAVSGYAQAVDDYSSWEGRAATLEAKEFGPVLGAPLKWQQTVIGAICLARRQGEERFTDDDIRFMTQIAGDAAIAIHQATLLEEVQQGQQRLQVLSHRLIDAQEAERKRLSRELHDQIGQALTAVQISLQSLQSSPGTNVPDDRLSETLTIIDHALEQVHDLSLDLRPSLLDDLGLVAALRWYVDRVASRAGLVRCFEADVLETRLAPQIETACFRIAQEALTNVLRHAHAATVWVRVKHLGSGLQLVVRDDGGGFDVRTVMSRSGVNASLGLQGMQERAAALGGVVEIRSEPGIGAEVQVSFPLTLTHSV